MALEKTFNATDAEPRLYAAWEEAGAFKAGANASRDETFCIMLPPPNVTGTLHMGHAFNHTLMDILTRWKRMQGYDTLWQPGLDHAGIATQMVVERELALSQQPSRQDLGRQAFTQKVWEWKEKSGGTIVEQDKRLGASMDWSREAFTMAGAPGGGEDHKGPNFHDAVIKVFVDMYNKGLIYRGKRLVNWDPHFETAISDLEVENTEVDGHMWHFKYPLAGGATYSYVEKDEDGTITLSEERDYISIATTRPETMLGDGAVAVHPSDERYAPIVGKLCEIPVGPKEHRRLIPIITDEYPDPNFGSGAVKITGAHDFNDYEVAKRGTIPMYNLMDTKGAMRADGRAYAEEAATAQRIAEGEESFDEAKIAAMNLVPEDYRGLDRFEARKAVVADITAEGLAVMTTPDDPRLGKRSKTEEGPEATDEVPLVEAKKIMQPFGDRSKVVIEPMLTDQWFVDTAKIVGPAIDAVRNGDTQILPEQDKKVYFHWLENIEPWCISRQLWWGHQIPVWYGPEIPEGKTRLDDFMAIMAMPGQAKLKAFCAPTFEEARAQAAEYYRKRVSIWGFNFLVAEAEAQAAGCSIDEANELLNISLTREEDVLDTWFSSGLWPIGTLGWPEETEALKKYFPTSVLITGFDIIFFWVARMMMMQYAVVGERPFDTVYVHALVRDEKGKKMSKSLGNVLDPLDLIDEFGADAVRFTLTAMAAMGRDLRLSTQRITGYRNFGTKLWNAHRFAEMNGVFEMHQVPDPSKDVHQGVPDPSKDVHQPVHRGCTGGVRPAQPSAALNKWIIGETARVRETVDAALDNYRFNEAANALYAFVWGKVCDWYVELSKPLLQDGAPEADETRATLGWVLDQCLILLHPIMPFITEELWQTTVKREKMLVHADWPSYTTADLLDADADREVNWVIGLIEGIRSARAQMHVPAGLQVPMLVTSMDPVAETAWARNETMIKRLARVESLEIIDFFPKGTVSIPVPGASFGLPLAGLIDIAEEKARLQKSFDKLMKEIGGLNGRLGNPKFRASAPEDVVAEAEANLAARQEEADQIQAALNRLAEID
ncbi:MAG: valine--tRNA ligase [Pseudomonadota bacterium]